MNPPQSPGGYPPGAWGAPPQGGYAPSGYGPPPGAYGPPGAMMPAWGAMGPAGAPTVLGVPLQPGERVIYFYKPSYSGDKIALIIVGILTVWILLGIIFLVMAAGVEKRNPRGQVVTNLRIIEVQGTGIPTMLGLGEAVDLTPERQNVRAGGGLLGAAIGAAASAIANSIAEKKGKMDPSYWTRTIAVLVATTMGHTFRMATRDPARLGPFLARCIFEPGFAQSTQGVPYEP